MFPSSENLSGPGISDTNLAASASASDVSNVAVVNLASVNHHPSSLGSVAVKDGVANNSSSNNPVLNRIATNTAGNIPVENVQVMQQQQQAPGESLPPKAGGSVGTRSNVAPGWRRIKFNCEIIYIR